MKEHDPRVAPFNAFLKAFDLCEGNSAPGANALRIQRLLAIETLNDRLNGKAGKAPEYAFSLAPGSYDIRIHRVGKLIARWNDGSFYGSTGQDMQVCENIGQYSPKEIIEDPDRFRRGDISLMVSLEGEGQ